MMRSGCLSLFLITAVACTSFGDAPPEPGAEGGVDGGADAGRPGDSGSPGDGGATLTFDFEDGGIGDNWQRAGEQPPQLVGNDCHNGSNKCLEAKASGSSKGHLFRKLPDAPNKVRIAAAVRVVKTSDGEVDFFGIRHVTDQGSWIVWPKNGPSYFVESASLVLGTKTSNSIGASFADWTRVEILFDRAPPTATWTIAGVTTAKATLPPTFSTGDVELEVGIRYAAGITAGEWVVRYDDIQITTE